MIDKITPRKYGYPKIGIIIGCLLCPKELGFELDEPNGTGISKDSSQM